MRAWIMRRRYQDGARADDTSAYSFSGALHSDDVMPFAMGADRVDRRRFKELHLMGWPLSQDYNEAIQSPESSFADSELRQGQAVTNAWGIPMPRSGNFADVYEVRCANGTRWAVKCFTREVPGLHDRYQEISRCLQQIRLSFTVKFTYLEQGIRIRGGWFPVLKMQWIEGLALNEFVRENLDKPGMLHALLQVWSRMGVRLREAGIAHADLQHGNVLLVPGRTPTSLALKLIDYDGMFVPSLAGKRSVEVGHPSYQHPQRVREGTFSPEVDRFPLLLIAAALRCLENRGRELWERYDNGDNLLFRETDLTAPRQSTLFRELKELQEPGARRLVDLLYNSLASRLEATPLLDDTVLGLEPVIAGLRIDEVATPLAAKPLAFLQKEEGPAPFTTERNEPHTPPPPQALSRRPTRRQAAVSRVEEFELEHSIAEKHLRRERRLHQRRQKKGGRYLWLAAGGVVAALLLVIVGGVGTWLLGTRLVLQVAARPRGGDDGIVVQPDPKQNNAEADALDPRRATSATGDVSSKPTEEAKKASGDVSSKPTEAAKKVDEGLPNDVTKPATTQSPKPAPIAKKVENASVRLVHNVAVPQGERPGGIKLSSDGGKAVSWSDISGTVSIWTMDARPKSFAPGNRRLAKGGCVAITPDGEHVVCEASNGKGLIQWGLSTLTEEATLSSAEKLKFRDVIISPDGSACATVTADQGIKMWSLKTQKEMPLERASTLGIKEARYLADNRRIVAVTNDGALQFWDIETGKALSGVATLDSAVESIALSPDGKYAAAMCRDNRIHVLDLETGRASHATAAMPAGEHHIAVSSTGVLVATSSNLARYQMWLWDLSTGKELSHHEGAEWGGAFLTFSGDDGKTLVGAWIGKSNWEIRVWQIITKP
jgi:hypothetical protein